MNDVVETLVAIYAETGKAVSARAIGEAVGKSRHQTLVYLHQAPASRIRVGVVLARMKYVFAEQPSRKTRLSSRG